MPHRIVQAEGSEQGDPLMPLLFSLAIHVSLQEVKSLMDPRDVLLAFLDDVYSFHRIPIVSGRHTTSWATGWMPRETGRIGT